MEVNESHRYDLKAVQLSSQIRKEEAKVGALKEEIIRRDDQLNRHKENFGSVKHRLLAAGTTLPPTVAMQRAESLTKRLQIEQRAANLLSRELGNLRAEEGEILGRIGLMTKRMDLCTEIGECLQHDLMQVRELCHEEEVSELAGMILRESSHGDEIGIEQIHERDLRSAEFGNEPDRLTLDRLEGEGLAIDAVEKDSKHTHSEGRDMREDQHLSEHAGREAFEQQREHSHGNPNEAAHAQLIAENRSAEGRARFAEAVRINQLADRIEQLVTERTGRASCVELAFIAKNGRRLKLKISGGAEMPLRVEIAPESAVDRRILWNDSREILKALQEAGIAVREVRVTAG